MHIIVSLLTLALLATHAPAVYAAAAPAPGITDPRLKWVVYNEREVIEVRGALWLPDLGAIRGG